MDELRERVDALSFPIVLVVFLALYVTSLYVGVEPELGLLRAGAAGLALAGVGRLAIKVLEHEPVRSGEWRVASGAAGDESPESGSTRPEAGPWGARDPLNSATLPAAPEGSDPVLATRHSPPATPEGSS